MCFVDVEFVRLSVETGKSNAFTGKVFFCVCVWACVCVCMCVCVSLM